MSHQSDLIATDIEAYLEEHENKDLLRFLTCGSVDDGKSTLIGRLLHDSHMIYEDQLAAVAKDSQTQGTLDGEIDLALLMDGLKAEREQGITIDVAYRYFSTARRKFIIADTPGHVQYTRNMVTGASTAQLAVVMVDARNGVLPQTKRHSTIAHLLGIRHVVVAVNKMDLVDWSQERFEEIVESYQRFATDLGATFDAYFLPMSALEGDNVVTASENMPWFDGPPLMEHLETVDVAADEDLDHLRLPVQLVSRPNLDFRGFQGTIASGVLRPGDSVTALPSGVSSTVDRIVTFDGDLDVAYPGQAVTITLTDEIDVSRGDVLVHTGEEMSRSHHVDAMLVWMAEEAMRENETYLLRSASGTSNAAVSDVRFVLDMDTLERTDEGDGIGLNDIARVEVSTDRELLFDRYATNHETGSFILVDRLTNATVAAGMIEGASSTWDARAVPTLKRQVSLVKPKERAIRYAQQPITVLLTGFTGAGKSTIAKALERWLFDTGRVAVRLDGQNVRQGVSRDLGFTAPERSENVRRVAEVARLLNEQGIIAIAAMTAPVADDRARARELVGADRFIEVHVDTPLSICRERDPGGLYSAIESGTEIDLPGVTSPYEAPASPDLRTNDVDSVDEPLEALVRLLRERGLLSSSARPEPN